jgi:hypothetical protein
MAKTIKFIILLIVATIGTNAAFARFVYCFKTGGQNASWYCVVVPKGSCSLEGYRKDPTGGGSYCKNYLLVPNRNPLIYVDKANRAVIDDGTGSITKVASTKIETFLISKKDHSATELAKLISTDNGKVSQANITAFAKEIKAKIIRVRKLPKSTICTACNELESAQNQ